MLLYELSVSLCNINDTNWPSQRLMIILHVSSIRRTIGRCPDKVDIIDHDIRKAGI